MRTKKLELKTESISLRIKCLTTRWQGELGGFDLSFSRITNQILDDHIRGDVHPQNGWGGGVISDQKNFIANLCKLAHIYEFSPKNAIKNPKIGKGGRRGVKGRLDFFQRNIHFGVHKHPLSVAHFSLKAFSTVSINTEYEYSRA